MSLKRGGVFPTEDDPETTTAGRGHTAPFPHAAVYRLGSGEAPPEQAEAEQELGLPHFKPERKNGASSAWGMK